MTETAPADRPLTDDALAGLSTVALAMLPPGTPFLVVALDREGNAHYVSTPDRCPLVAALRRDLDSLAAVPDDGSKTHEQ